LKCDAVEHKKHICAVLIICSRAVRILTRSLWLLAAWGLPLVTCVCVGCVWVWVCRCVCVGMCVACVLCLLCACVCVCISVCVSVCVYVKVTNGVPM